MPGNPPGTHPDQPAATAAVPSPVAIREITCQLLSIPLRHPFVIASARIDATRAVLVRATLEDPATGQLADGWGEAAALPPVTREDQPDLFAAISTAALGLAGSRLEGFEAATATIARALPGGPVARAAVETAVVDAWARLAGVPLARALRDGVDPGSARSALPMPLPVLTTDITLSIAEPDAMAALAARHRADGFACFKVKVGRDWRSDRASLRAVAAAVPDARFRLDANAGFTADDALALLEGVLGDGLTVECYEQPCATDDWAGMAFVTARSPVPIVADESFRGGDDLDRLLGARAAHAVNLKLVKLGGPLAAVALARRARAAGLRLMAGAMVETRVGLLAMAHVVAAVGGVEWVDLDTAFLLTDDPFEGGWSVSGPHLTLTGQPGLGVRPR